MAEDKKKGIGAGIIIAFIAILIALWVKKKHIVLPIDIGSAAIQRATVQPFQTTDGRTEILKDNPANANGIITTVEIWSQDWYGTPLKDCKVGIFYKTNGNTLKCRSATYIGTVTAGSKQTFSGLSLDVQAGDYIGMYADYGAIQCDTSGYAGLYSTKGDTCVPGYETDYDFEPSPTLSLYGSGIE